MEPRDLEYFAVVAEHGNLRRAAEALNLSQPALSKSLRRLERWTQMKVVKRTPKGVELTTVGAALLSHAQRLHLSLDDIEHEVAALRNGEAGHVRAGADVFCADNLMPNTCAAFLKDARKTTAKIVIGPIDMLLSALHKGDLDLIVTTIPAFSDEDVVQPLFEQDFAVYASTSHRLARLKRVTIDDLIRERWVFPVEDSLSWQWVRHVFAEHDLPAPTTALETPSLSIKLHVVASTDLLGFTGTRVLRQAASRLPLVDLRVKEFGWSVRLGVRYRKHAYVSPAVHRFITALQGATRDFLAQH